MGTLLLATSASGQIVVAQAQMPPSGGPDTLPSYPPPINLWDVFINDPVIWGMTAAFALALAVSWWNGRIGRRHLHRQETYLDHQQATNDRAIAQTEETNRLIAERYARSDEIERQIVARTEESLRLHGEAVAQLAELNATISRIARRLDSLEPPRSA